MDISTLRHSVAHLLAHAVKILFPKAKLGIGPAIEDGFYYDFDNVNFTPDSFKKIEEKMKELAGKNYPFKKITVDYKKAREMLKNEPYKLDILKGLKSKKITFYQDGDFIDLCKGPHIKSTGKIRAFKLLKIAGAYWKGDEKNPMLQRIYGTAFENESQLKEFLKNKKEAERRDHRRLGKELDLFSFQEEGPGFVFWHPKGMTVIDKLSEFIKELYKRFDYKEIKTPTILNKNLWLTSGHYEHYKENMYFTTIDKKEFAVKPMNCPGCILVYKNSLHSYKELPLRFAEFGLVHRHELSGVLAGLFRVRAFVQDDAHIFCTEQQIENEIKSIIKFIDIVYKTFNFKYDIVLSTRPKKFIGDVKLWNKAEGALKAALKGLSYKIDEGEGAFYGPKIDFIIEDAMKRKWQLATIQLDFQMPKRFNLTYEGQDGKKHVPVMIHRAALGSLERFIGILLENFNGKLPLWLNPLQVKIVTLADRNIKYASEVKKELDNYNIRNEIDAKPETMAKKIRDAELGKPCCIIIIGDKEEKNKTIAIRENNETRFNVNPDKFIKEVVEKINERYL
ncbi:MAG: threonine--tRNA ligase [Nanoarchaeota archaeon]